MIENVQRIFIFHLFVLQAIAFVTECPPNSVQFNEGICYEIYLNKNVPYQEAERFCSEKNGTLPVVKNQENLLLLARLHARQKLGNYWIGMTNTNNQWQYVSDGQLVVHNKGKSDRQDFYDCGAIFAAEDYKWGSEGCYSKLFYICQFSKNICGNSSCYKVSQETATFRKAKSHCENQGGTLAEIRNTANHEAIIETARTNRAWLNITEEMVITEKLTNSESFWLKAIYDSKMGTWKNSTYINELPVFQNRSSIPLMQGLECVSIQKLNNKLRNCTNLNHIICQFELLTENQLIRPEPGTEETAAAESQSTERAPTILQSNATPDSTLNMNSVTTEKSYKLDVNAEIQVDEHRPIMREVPVSTSNSTASNKTIIVNVHESSTDWRSLAIAAFVVICCGVFVAVVLILVKFACRRDNNDRRPYTKKEYKKVSQIRLESRTTRGVPNDQVRWSVVRCQDENESNYSRSYNPKTKTQRGVSNESISLSNDSV